MTEIVEDKSSPKIRRALIEIITEIEGTNGNLISVPEAPTVGTVKFTPEQALRPKIVPVGVQEFASGQIKTVERPEVAKAVAINQAREAIEVEASGVPIQLIRSGSRDLSPFELVQKRERDKAA